MAKLVFLRSYVANLVLPRSVSSKSCFLEVYIWLRFAKHRLQVHPNNILPNYEVSEPYKKRGLQKYRLKKKQGFYEYLLPKTKFAKYRL